MSMQSGSLRVNPAATWFGRLSALLPLALFLGFAFVLPEVAAGSSIAFSVRWVPSMNIEIVFLIDGLGVLFGLIISGIGVLITLYADAYMTGKPRRLEFFFYLHAFMLSMIGLVLSDHLLVMFVFWELTTLFSFFLIGFEHTKAAARESARQALLVTGGGGLAMLLGILMLEQATGAFTFSELVQKAADVRTHAMYLPILLCILAGAFTKSAQFPFHFWLPNAMSAPTPISAYLHSATMVKAGVYLLARMHPILGATPEWMTTLVIIGAFTAAWGSVMALAQHDLKRILAHTTIMALGIITMFLGGQKTPALTAAMTFLLVHALYKSALFMVAGAIDHQAGTRDIAAIGGMGTTMPVTAAATLMAALSMAGFPLFLGFIGKEIMYKGALAETVFPGLATLAALFSNALMASVAAILAIRPFWGRPGRSMPKQEAHWPLWLGPTLLGMVSLGFGLIPDWVGRWLVEPAVRAFHFTPEDIQLKLFYGFNEALLLSILTLIIGAIAYLSRKRLQRIVIRFATALPLTAQAVFDGGVKTTMAIGGVQTRILQNGSLFNYIAVIVGAVVGLAAWAIVSTPTWRTLSLPEWRLDSFGWLTLVQLLMIASVVTVVRTRSRLLAICGLGIVGAGMAVIFIAFGAPDVGLTQVLVETLTLIIASLVLLRLPRIPPKDIQSAFQKTIGLAIAVSSGVLVAGLLLLVTHTDIDRTITEFYEQASYLKAHGRNIVNVILVDFRSLDTLGEITVVAASAVAALALIRKKKETP